MCGIFGYIGKREAPKILLEGLKRLEYRGYDSFGMAIFGSPIHVFKDVGKIEKLASMLPPSLNSTCGIAHTRWATHGRVTKENAHPHLSCDGKIVVVHNGIIENYSKLKEFLIQRGHVFRSETDTEVISHLLEEMYKQGKDVLECIREVCRMLEGSFAFLAIFEGIPYIFAVRYKSPLVIGVGDGEVFVSSDVPAFLKYTRNVIYLEDMEVAKVGRNSVEVYDILTGERKRKKIEVVRWKLEDAEKDGYPHFMMKEIMDQKETLTRVFGQEEKILQVADLLKDAERIFLTAAGTSYHACLAFKYWLADLGYPSEAILASEFPNILKTVNEGSVIIAVSQSGETADVLEAVRMARKKGAKVISLINVIGSSLMRMSDIFLSISAGPEICVVATKTYTSQLALLYLISRALTNELEKGREDIKIVSASVRKMLENCLVEKVRGIVRALNKPDVYLIGRGLSYVTALEGALKLKEVAYIHAEGMAGGELKHGTLALIEKGVPCIALVQKDEAGKDVLSNVEEIKTRGGEIFGISEEMHHVFDVHIPIEDPIPLLSPICQIIPIQLLSYFLAVKRGCDPDKPRNLAKSVTVK